MAIDEASCESLKPRVRLARPAGHRQPLRSPSPASPHPVWRGQGRRRECSRTTPPALRAARRASDLAWPLARLVHGHGLRTPVRPEPGSSPSRPMGASMVTSRNGLVAGAVVIVLLAAWVVRFGGAQVPGQDPGHGDHGTPASWRFAWPTGDPARGRDIFVKYECFSCHEVRGEPFSVPQDAGNVGPELAAMGPAHQAEYFVEAIINPNAVVERGTGLRGGGRLLEDAVVQRYPDGPGVARSGRVSQGAAATACGIRGGRRAGWPCDPLSACRGAAALDRPLAPRPGASLPQLMSA